MHDPVTELGLKKRVREGARPASQVCLRGGGFSGVGAIKASDLRGVNASVLQPVPLFGHFLSSRTRNSNCLRLSLSLSLSIRLFSREVGVILLHHRLTDDGTMNIPSCGTMRRTRGLFPKKVWRVSNSRLLGKGIFKHSPYTAMATNHLSGITLWYNARVEPIRVGGKRG